MAQTGDVKGLPRVWAALVAINTKNLTGVLEVQTETGIARISVDNGKVVNLSSVDFSPEHVVHALNTMRILSDSDMVRARKMANKEGISPVQAVTNLQLAQENTVARVQEFLLKESLLKLMIDETASVSFTKELPGAVAYTLRMPIPFLLKEAQKRQKEWAAIKTKVPFMQAVFQRKPAVDPVSGANLAWEDLPIQGIEKIVYFFLDGKRTVADIANTAFISQFDAARSVYSLLNQDLAVKVSYYKDDDKPQKVKKHKGRLALMFAYIVLLITTGLVGFGISRMWLDKITPATVNHAARLIQAQTQERLQTALYVFKARNGRWPEDFNELLEAKLALIVDKKAAMLVKKPQGPGYLYEGDETP